MDNRHTQLYMFAGSWLSLVAVVIGGSLLLPPAKDDALRSSALLYKFAINDAPKNEQKAPSTGRALIANLESMELSLYDDATFVKTFSILSKGRPGTPWETPSGSYAIQLKETKHLSSIGGTWMPYSMQFYGNFFIHGWPTYPNGKEVPVGYSGGCIRLSTSDAREVYEFVPKGGKLIVLGSTRANEFATSSRYYLHGEGIPPSVSAGAFVVQDVETGKILWEHNADDLRNPGGLTALTTALTAIETVNQYKLVRMSELLLGKSVLRKHSIGAIDEMPVGTLIYPLLFDINDTAAKVFAREHGTKQFVRYMNEKSHAIGMGQTIFSGALSVDGSTTTARDLATLLRYVEKEKHFLIDVTMTKEQTLTDEDGDERYTWSNKNPWMISGDGAYRGGIVSVDANNYGGAMVMFDLPVSEFGRRKISITLLDSVDIWGDVTQLQNFIVKHFVYGIENDSAIFLRETEEPTPGLIKKAKDLINLEQLLRDEVEYQREV